MNPDQIPFPNVIAALVEMTEAAGVDMLLVGATARDIALAVDGSDTSLRATNDVDIAVAVANVAAFDLLVAGLDRGRPTSAHKFLVEGVEVDVVPFGGVERPDRTIVWPDGSTMNTMGFAEALQSAIQVDLGGNRAVAVASLAAQAALKMFAWTDRGSWTDRDAVDLRSLLLAYSNGRRLDDIYAQDRVATLETYDFDVRRAGAHALGVDVGLRLGDVVARRCVMILEANRDMQRLAQAMRADFAESWSLLEALRDGLRQ